MLSNLARKIKTSIAGVASKTGARVAEFNKTQMASGFLSSAALKTATTMANNPILSGAGIGAATGFISSGGMWSGAAMGAGLGAFGGSRGWGDYRKTGLRSGARLERKLAGKIGSRISPDASFLAANKMPFAGASAGSIFGGNKSSVFKKLRSANNIIGNRKLTGAQIGSLYGSLGNQGLARNVGGKMIGQSIVGAGKIAAAGAIGGLAVSGTYGMLSARHNSSVNGFRSQQPVFGSSFPGMGNGIRSY